MNPDFDPATKFKTNVTKNIPSGEQDINVLDGKGTQLTGAPKN